jgi:presenilin-like A22 family membrane protease
LTVEWVRFGNIGIAVGTAILVVGALVFRNSGEAALQAVGLIGLFAGLAVGLFLDGRARKRRGEGPQ